LILEKHVTAPPDSQKNFLVVDSKTDNAAIEEAFERFTTERKDIGILLINQHVGVTNELERSC
jgi:V-type H+-transporting ATPase subunit F